MDPSGMDALAETLLELDDLQDSLDWKHVKAAWRQTANRWSKRLQAANDAAEVWRLAVELMQHIKPNNFESDFNVVGWMSTESSDAHSILRAVRTLRAHLKDMHAPASSAASGKGASSAADMPSIPEGLVVGEPCLAMGLHAGQRRQFKALFMGIRTIKPEFLVKYVADVDGRTMALLLPEVRNTYVPVHDLAPFRASAPLPPISARTRGQQADRQADEKRTAGERKRKQRVGDADAHSSDANGRLDEGVARSGGGGDGGDGGGGGEKNRVHFDERVVWGPKARAALVSVAEPVEPAEPLPSDETPVRPPSLRTRLPAAHVAFTLRDAAIDSSGGTAALAAAARATALAAASVAAARAAAPAVAALAGNTTTACAAAASSASAVSSAVVSPPLETQSTNDPAGLLAKDDAEPSPDAEPVDRLLEPQAEPALLSALTSSRRLHEEKMNRKAAHGSSLTADEARTTAAEEGLMLVPANNETGFKGVRREWIGANRPGSSKLRGAAGGRFRARFAARGGVYEDLGVFDTAEEAALAYARRIGKDASMELTMAQRSLTAEEAIAQAAAEGLTLVRGSSATGYKGVCFDRDSANGKRRFVAQVHEKGRSKFLKLTDTPEEAALVYARYIGSAAAKAAANPSRLRSGMTSDEALAQAAAEGLSLIVAQSVTGYRNVFATAEGRFTAKPKEKGVWIHLGRFDTAQEAALVYARHRASQGVASGETLRGGAAVVAARNARAAAAAEALEPTAIVGLGQLFSMGPQSRVE